MSDKSVEMICCTVLILAFFAYVALPSILF
jgi:hypothetical protein